MRRHRSRSLEAAYSAHSSRRSNRCWSASMSAAIGTPLSPESHCARQLTSTSPSCQHSAVDARGALTLADVLREHARSRPDATAVVERGYRATYPELDERVNRLAHALGGAGGGASPPGLWLPPHTP